MLTKKSRFFDARLPLKISTFWRSQLKWISQNSTKGDPLGRQRVESLRGRVRPGRLDLGTLLFRQLKMGRNFVFGCFSYFFHAKSDDTNNHRTWLSDISY